MGVLEVIVGVFVLIIVMVILMQPITVLTGVADTQLTTANATDKLSTNSDGDLVSAGASSSLPAITQMFMYGLGLFIVIGFVIWMVRNVTRPTEVYTDEFL